MLTTKLTQTSVEILKIIKSKILFILNFKP